jgi:hypothetical protein
MTNFEQEAKAILLQILHDTVSQEDGNLQDFYDRMNANADDITALLNKHRTITPVDPKPE